MINLSEKVLYFESFWNRATASENVRYENTRHCDMHIVHPFGIWHDIGEYQAAVEGFREASDLRPDKYSHFICLGKVYLRWGGHAAEALDALTTSLRLEHTTVAANLAAKAKAALEESSKVHSGRKSKCLCSKKE